MNFVANADALIFDMHGPGGGEPLTVVFLESYLFDQPTHVNDVWTRSTDTTRQFWTQSQVPGKRVSTAQKLAAEKIASMQAGARPVGK